jgi:general secretion pathway protein F
MKIKKFVASIEIQRKINKVIIESESIDIAKRRAKSMGKVISIEPKRGFDFEIPMDAGERQILLQRLSAMLASRVGAGEALSLMTNTFSGPISKVSGRMLKFVEAGDSIGQAMTKVGTKHFSSQIIALVQAGEKAGDTAKAIRNAAEFEVEMDRIKKSSGMGVMSGLASFGIAAGLILGTKFWFAPQMLQSDILQMKWDVIEGTVTFWDNVATYSSIFMGLFFGFLLFVLFLSTVGRWTMPTRSDRIIMKIPIVKDLMLAKNNYTALFGLSMLIESGVSMEQSLSISAKSTRKGQMQEDFKSAHAAVRKGKPWAAAMYGLHPTDKAALSTSEDREQIARSLIAIADQYKAIYASKIAITAPLLQSVAALFLLIGGGVLFGMSILPMLQVSAGGI